MSYSKVYCQNDSIPYGGATINLSITDVRRINTKLIEAKFNKQRLVIKDSIIASHEQRFNALNNEVNILQNKLNDSNNINKSLNTELAKNRKKANILSGVAISSITAFIVSLFIR